jgi:hypothetical protein
VPPPGATLTVERFRRNVSTRKMQELSSDGMNYSVIPNRKMLATDDYPTRASRTLPLPRGGLGRGVINVLGAFGELV